MRFGPGLYELNSNYVTDLLTYPSSAAIGITLPADSDMELVGPMYNVELTDRNYAQDYVGTYENDTIQNYDSDEATIGCTYTLQS